MSLKALSWAFDEVPVENPTLTPTQRFVLVTLANYANANFETYPKQSTIAEKTGYSRQTVNTTIRELTSMGLVDCTPRFYENGSRRSSVYRLNVPGRDESSINDDDGPLSNRPTGVTPHHVNDNDKGCKGPRRALSATTTTVVGEPDNNNRVLEPSLEPEQDTQRRSTAPWPADWRDQFWKAYPKRKGNSRKKAIQALEVIERAGKIEFSVIMSGLSQYAQRMTAEVRKDPKRAEFIAHAITWINQERWESEDVDEASPISSNQAAHARIRARGVFV